MSFSERKTLAISKLLWVFEVHTNEKLHVTSSHKVSLQTWDRRDAIIKNQNHLVTNCDTPNVNLRGAMTL